MVVTERYTTEQQDALKPHISCGLIHKRRHLMHNKISQNQLASWNHVEKTPLYTLTDDLIDDYFECIIDCETDNLSCRTICTDLLR